MKYDSVIIGFGKGGKTLAAALAGRGEKVAVIEKSNKMYGGTCINVGCIPSKSLVRSSGLSRLNSTDSFDAKDEKYKKAIEEKRRVTGSFPSVVDAPPATVAASCDVCAVVCVVSFAALPPHAVSDAAIAAAKTAAVIFFIMIFPSPFIGYCAFFASSSAFVSSISNQT